MTPVSELHLVIPGPLEQRTGGYLYDARMVEGLQSLGWKVTVHSLEGRFPIPDKRAEETAAQTLAKLPDEVTLLIDGLALPAISPEPEAHFERVRALALIHHLTYEETGINTLEIKYLKYRETRILGHCLGVIVTSDFTVSRVRRLGVPVERIRVVIPGTQPAQPAGGPAPGAPPALLCVGALIPRKGQDVLLRALARISDDEWSCVLAGSLNRDPAFAAAVQRLSEEAGLTERVHFAGECDAANLEELYDRSSLFVLPSHYEGFGMAIAEAIARGIPVISTNAGAIPHTLPSDAGILVPPGDDVALASAISRLVARTPIEGARGLGRHDERSRLAAAALRHAASLPNWEQQTQAFADAIVSLTT